MKKIKLLSSLATIGVIGIATPIVSTSCSTSPDVATNWMMYEGRKYEFANNFNPNYLCGEEFLIPLKNGTILPVVSLFKASITKLVLNIPNIRVKSINDHFLEGCTGLMDEKSLDLSGLSGVESIGNYFLSGCTSLTSFDFTPLKSLNHIGGGFAYRCGNLTHVNTAYLDMNNFEDSEFTFSTDDPKTRGYGVGVQIEGEYKSNLYYKFRQENGENDLYRYLVTDKKNFITAYIPTVPGGSDKTLQRLELESTVGFDEFTTEDGVVTVKIKGQATPLDIDCTDLIIFSLRKASLDVGINNFDFLILLVFVS